MTDEQLMQEVKQGDLTKASILFERYNKHLYNFFVKISYDRELGHDLTQNVFLRMIKFRNTYKQDGSFKSWIFQIARNVNADHYRKNKLKSNSIDDIENIGNDIRDIDESLMKNEQERVLYMAMEKLSTEERELLNLSKFQKLKYEEIAGMTQTTVGAIKVKVHRAMHKLKENYFRLEKI